MDDLKQIVANNITELRKSARLTQVELAEKLNYTDKAVSKWERGESLPDVAVLKQIADMFGVTVDYILTPGVKEDKENLVIPKEARSNQMIISLLGVTFVWILAVVIFVYTSLWMHSGEWMAFLWAIPASSVVLLLFNAKWGKRSYYLYLSTVFVWSLLTCIYLQSLKYNIWLIYILGLPVQVALILWSNLKKSKRS